MEDKAYVAARNKLIPEAEATANKVAGPKPEKDGPARESWVTTWNRTFHSTMDALARQAGLVR